MFTSLRTSVVLHCICNVFTIQCLYMVASDFQLGTYYLLLLLLIASVYSEVSLLSWIPLIPNQFRFTESKKDFLLDLHFFYLKFKAGKESFITIQINVIKEKSFLILCHHHNIWTLIAKFAHFYYVVLNKQLLIILCDEVVPVVNLEEVDCRVYLLRRKVGTWPT